MHFVVIDEAHEVCPKKLQSLRQTLTRVEHGVSVEISTSVDVNRLIEFSAMNRKERRAQLSRERKAKGRK